MTWRLHRGDCLELMAGLEPESIDALVCDPPYGLGKPPPIEEVLAAWLAGDAYEVSGGGFMGRKWDAFVPGPHFWRLAFAAMKPGAHGVVFAGQRTIDVMGIALRLAGFEVRDLIGWQYWSGFPKSHDVSKAIDRAAGADREVVGMGAANCHYLARGEPCRHGERDERSQSSGTVNVSRTAPATPDAARWEGWGTALKPSIEPALLIRKPLSGTVAANVLRYGTGGLNVDGCRYPFGDPGWPGLQDGPQLQHSQPRGMGYKKGAGDAGSVPKIWAEVGRWPANVYACPKASTAERERGCDGLPQVRRTDGRKTEHHVPNLRTNRRRNHHPTVKPVRLLRWLARLVTPPGGAVLDPFAGSGSCGVAAVLEGFEYVGAELEVDYQPIAEARIAHAVARPDQWLDTRPGLPVDEDTIEAAEAEAMGQIGLFGGEP